MTSDIRAELDKLDSICKRSQAAYDALPSTAKESAAGAYYLSAMNRAKDKIRQIREAAYA